MKAISLFSGVGGLDLGLHAAGIETVQFVEIDKHARGVLAYHWPHTPIHDDVTTFNPEHPHGAIDLVHGGSPCQDLSVAGKRAGLDGSRSGLFWHQCRIARQVAAPWFLWENVPGALSSNRGADFAAVLWGITGALPEVPAGGWRNSGIIVGPERVAVWRVLDARHFGVAQRRRRVFVVGGPRNGRAIEVLLEPESVCRDSVPSRAAEEEVAGTLGGGSGGRGRMPGRLIAFRMQAFGQYVDGAVASTLKARDGRDATDLVVTDSGVRRLTPREHERLMGWPDDHTLYKRFDGEVVENADSHRYKGCGNGVVAPNAEWIGRRLVEVAA